MINFGHRFSTLLGHLWSDIRSLKNLINFVTIAFICVIFALKVSQREISTAFTLSLLTGAVGLLLMKAISNEWLLKGALNKTVRPMYKDWLCPEVENLLGSASKSITIVQSYVPDSPFLAKTIADAVNRLGASGQLEINIYMLDPDRMWGAARLHELELSGLSAKADNEDLDDNEKKRFDELLKFDLPTINEKCQKFHGEFESARDTLTQNLAMYPKAKVRFFAYPTAPAIKIYAIDDNEFLFGWLGLDGRSTHCPCFHVSERSESLDMLNAVQRLKLHLKVLKRCSREITE